MVVIESIESEINIEYEQFEDFMLVLYVPSVSIEGLEIQIQEFSRGYQIMVRINSSRFKIPLAKDRIL